MSLRQPSESVLEFIQKNPTRCNNVSKFIIPYLYEAQHVSGDTPLIIRSLKLHYQPLVLHTWKVIRRVVAGRCQVEYELAHCTAHYQEPKTALPASGFAYVEGC